MTSLVLATDVEGVLTSRALAKAGQWFSPSLLISVETILIVLWWTTPGINIWLPSLWLALIGVGVVTTLRASRLWVGVLSVVLGSGVAAFLYAISLAEELAIGSASDSLLFSLPKIAAVVAGVGGRSLRSCITLCSLGFGLTGATSIIAARHTGLVVAFDVPAFATYIALIVLLIVLWKARGGAATGTSEMNLAAQVEEGLSEESRIISHASSLLHDTVLNDLQALALSPTGTLSDAHREVIRRDLDLLSGDGDLLLPPRSSISTELRSRAAEVNPLASAIERSTARGTHVVVSGDPTVLIDLPAPVEQAVVMAVDQCLVNVSVHSGVAAAEVAVSKSAHEISVMITDSGRGFDTQATSSERLGLRLSVYDRIHAVGGSVNLWSSPGAGTAILLTIPVLSGQAGKS